MASERLNWLGEDLERLHEAGLRRELRSVAGPQAAQMTVDGREVVNFGSNDYLGLASDPRLGEAAIRAIETMGWGSGASPLICGRTAIHGQLEQKLADFEGTEAALLFPSGFAANTGSIPALVGREDAIFGDAKNHASIIDGCRLSRARVYVYPHNDVAALKKMLTEAAPSRRRLIVTDGLFSMDGDLAPLQELAELAKRFDCMLMVDEAHATGIFGEHGRGVSEYLGVEDCVDIRIGTLSKALGGSGGFVVGEKRLIDWLLNRSRSYVFSTAHPAAGYAAMREALRIVQQEPARRRELLVRSQTLREQLLERGWRVGPSESQIIPIVIGDAASTMQMAMRLIELGYFVPGIRPPSVPEGECLLRISLSWGHSEAQLGGLIRALEACRTPQG